MVEVVYRVVTWGLLGVFASFLTYGLAVTAYTLFRFYHVEFTKLATGRAPK